MCLVYHTLFADETTPTPKSDAHLYGHVIDSKTGEHLPYATVTIPGTTIGTMTDASGHYFLKNLPTGTITVEARMMSYDPVRHEVTLKKGQSLELNFEITENGITMDDVVVSASRSETTRRKAPALVNVLDRKIFDNTNSACLAQGLSFQPGVRVEDDCQNCGFMQVRINGLDGHYSQILVDSHPVFSALSGVYGLEQIPASMIDRVEVMRGGGSALFGSSAIGGTINIITKDPDRNSAEVGHTITAIGNSSSYDNVTSANASLITDSRKAGLYVYGQNRHRSGYDHDGDGFTEIPQLQSQALGLRSFFKTSAYSRITLQYNTVMEYRRGGDRLDLPPHEAMIAEQTDHNINGGSLSFDLSSADYSNRVNVYASFQHIARKSYYGSKQDPDAYGRTHDLTVATGAQYIHSFDRLWFLPADLTLGVEYNYNDLDDESIGYDYRTKQKVHIIGAYLQNEWKNEHWSLLIGGRLDKHSLVDHVIFSPRANLRYNPGEGASLRLSYSSGFRAPQAFDEDMHISAVGGEIAMIQRAKDLKEEKQQEPFFKIIQTSSSHEPFEVPFYRLDDKVLNAFAYADSCVGDFVRQYKETPMWKNTLIVLVPDHLGAYPRPVENPLEGHTIPLILIGGAVKEPRVVETYASQIDIAATLLSQLGLPHDDFTFSKNIFNPASPHFGYFTEPTLFGMVTAENQLVYNLDANTVQIDEGTEKGANLEKGKAFLQKLYDDLAKR